MRTTIFVVLSLVSILWSSTASAWAFSFDIEFENQRGHSKVWVKLFAGEDTDSDQVWATAQIYEVGVHVREKLCHNFRSGTAVVVCAATATDYSLSEGCNYCNTGGKVGFEHSSVARGDDDDIHEAQSTIFPLNVRCDLPPDPD